MLLLLLLKLRLLLSFPWASQPFLWSWLAEVAAAAKISAAGALLEASTGPAEELQVDCLAGQTVSWP